MRLTLTNRAADKPTKLSGVELPSGTIFFSLWRTFFNHPARLLLLISASYPGDQEKKLSLRMGWDPAPSLLIAVYCLYRGPEQLGHLLLGFVQDFTKR